MSTTKDTKLTADALAVAQAPSQTWGWLPALSLLCAAGVLLVAVAYEGGRMAAPWADSLFWVGLLVLFLPIAVRLFSPQPTRRERLALLIVLGIAFYLVKYLQYPLDFAYFDEFIHWRTAQDIVATGHLFHPNPILDVSPYYPGLELVTQALSSLTGLSLFASGVVVICAAQSILVLALYLAYEALSDSPHMAGIATVLYMANPGFLSTDLDFAYESLALPLAVFVLCAVILRGRGFAGRQKGLTLAIWLALGAVVITHHLTSYALVAFLLLWTLLFLLLRAVAFLPQKRALKTRLGPSAGGVALLALLLSVAWLIFSGDIALGYLAQYPLGAIKQFSQILAGESQPRQLFHSATGIALPLWERVLSYGSVVLILLGLPFGLFQIWRRHRTNAIFLALAGAALAYPASLLFHLTSAGAEGSERASEFVFLGVAFVLALGATKFWLSRTPHWRRSLLVMSIVGVVFLGQVLVGNAQIWARLPGPYLVTADQRSIEPEGIAAARWADGFLGSGQRIVTDRINMLLMTTYGDEWAVKAENADAPISAVFLSRQVSYTIESLLHEDGVQFVVVDQRLSTALPQIKTVFDIPLSSQQLARPIDPLSLAKFNDVQDVSKVFDSGNIVIYDVTMISKEAPPITTPNISCTPAPLASGTGSYQPLARIYNGTLYDIPAGRKTHFSLTGIRQLQRSICGYFNGIPTSATANTLPANGPIQGSITTAGAIQFTLIGEAKQTTDSFEGQILSDGTMVGTYCRQTSSTGACSDYGLWSVSPRT